MNNKFALSFGISLIIVGIICFFLGVDDTILFALSVCTSLFSFINIIISKIDKNKGELLYVIPFFLLIAFLCFKDTISNDIFYKIVNSKITNVLTFSSFGFLFVSEYINHKIEMSNIRIHESELVIQDYEYSNMIMIIINKYLEKMVNNKRVIDDDVEMFVNEINELCIEKSRLSDTNATLLGLRKDYYTLEDFNNAYKSCNDKVNYNMKMKEFKKNQRIKKQHKNKK